MKKEFWEVHVIREDGVDEMSTGLELFPFTPHEGMLLNCFAGRTWVVTRVLFDTMKSKVSVWVDEAEYMMTPIDIWEK